VAGADGGGGVHACGWGPHPCQFQVDLIGAGVGTPWENSRSKTTMAVVDKTFFVVDK
jgi:hypothetical protein